ncbi:MAG: ROK family protein [Dermatophilaceae bacterium]
MDIGGTKTHAVVIDSDGRSAQQLRLPTGFGSNALLVTAVEAVSRVAALAGISAGDFKSIGIGIPGTVDNASGRVTHAVNLGIDDLDLGAELGERLGLFVHVENDVNAAAFGAFHLRGAHQTSSMAYLNLGTGLAAGLVLNGELWRGSRSAAGEIGHIPVDPNGPACSCGQRGCLETTASGSAVARQWPTTHPRPVQELFEAAHHGNALARDVKQSLVENVASAVRALVLTVDVDIVVLGDGISSLGEPLLGEVRAVLDSRAAMSPFVASLGLGDRVRIVPSDFPAAAVGAALLGTAMSEVDSRAVAEGVIVPDAAAAGSVVAPSRAGRQQAGSRARPGDRLPPARGSLCARRPHLAAL